jgi:hypothetical protein
MPIERTYNQTTYPAGFGSLTMSAFGGGRPGSGGFTYNDTPYIHALNSALQLEHAAVAIYLAKQRTSYQIKRSGASAIDRTDRHHAALRQLVRLIFAQRGLPDTDPAGLAAMTGTVAARVSRYMPTIVQDPGLGVSAQRIELALARRYRQLLELAPESDRVLIHDLLDQVSEFSSSL